MKDRVIEPSEIILEDPHKGRENITHVNPWIRLIARFFDYSLFFFCLLLLKKFFHWNLSSIKYADLIPFEYLAWIPIEASLLTFFGTTPGKFFLKTQVKRSNQKKFDFLSALRRSLAVWFRGLGMGIIGINFFCLMIAYHKLKVFHTTSWDREAKIQVTHYPIGRWRIYVAIFVIIFGLLSYAPST